MVLRDSPGRESANRYARPAMDCRPVARPALGLALGFVARARTGQWLCRGPECGAGCDGGLAALDAGARSRRGSLAFGARVMGLRGALPAPRVAQAWAAGQDRSVRGRMVLRGAAGVFARPPG